MSMQGALPPGPAVEAENRADEPILRWFEFSHLPDQMQGVSGAFADLAQSVVDNLPRNPERTVALRKLLEAKDAAVRAKIQG